jgi:hypothetical protein
MDGLYREMDSTMKRNYSKPKLEKREILSRVTAGGSLSLGDINNPGGPS